MVFSVLVCAPFFMFAILILLVPGRLSVRQRPPLASELDFDTNPNPRVSATVRRLAFGGVWVRIRGSDSVFPPSSDSDRFRHSGFGFGSVPPGQVRIRIGSAGPGSDSDRIRLRRFGFGSDTGSVRILHPNPGLERDGDGSLELNKLIAPRDLLCIARDVRSCALNQLIF